MKEEDVRSSPFEAIKGKLPEDVCNIKTILYFISPKLKLKNEVKDRLKMIRTRSRKEGLKEVMVVEEVIKDKDQQQKQDKDQKQKHVEVPQNMKLKINVVNKDNHHSIVCCYNKYMMIEQIQDVAHLHFQQFVFGTT